MKIRNLTVVAASAALAAMLTVGSAERAEAHRGWGWGGLAAGIAATAILSHAYHHHHSRHYYRHHRRKRLMRI